MTNFFPWHNTSGGSQNSMLGHQFLHEISHSLMGPKYVVCFNHQAGLCCWSFIPPCGFGGWGSWKSGLLDILLHSSMPFSSFSASILSFKKASPPYRDTSPLTDLRTVQRRIRNRDFSGAWSTCVTEKTSSVHLGWRLHFKRMNLFLPGHLVEFPYNTAWPFEGAGLLDCTLMS